jgi:hypothetical protein
VLGHAYKKKKKLYYEEYSIISKVLYAIRIKDKLITVFNTYDLFH